jgi:hypothetical protein
MSSVRPHVHPDSRAEASRQLYKADEHEWIRQQIAALREGRTNDIDRENLAEFLSDMAARDQRELGSHFVVLLQHLLKVRIQPEKMTRSWLHTIANQQDEIRRIFRKIPSIVQYADQEFAEAYPDAIREAAAETGIPPGQFPATPPWTIEEALDFVVPELPAASAPRRKRSRVQS